MAEHGPARRSATRRSRSGAPWPKWAAASSGQDAMVERLMVGPPDRRAHSAGGRPGAGQDPRRPHPRRVLHASFSRIQFTPDLLPADVLGTMVFDLKTQEFGVKKGPIFANILLADEINRAPAKVQSALLEAMQERQVTIGGHSYPLAEPFLVLATQNPIESEGTYPLPEAQLDRFLLKVHVGYPSRNEEKEILLRMSAGRAIPVEPMLTPEGILAARAAVVAVAARPADRGLHRRPGPRHPRRRPRSDSRSWRR